MLNTIALLTAGDAAGAAGETAGAVNPTATLISQLVIFGVIIFFMYFIMIRPQKKKEKEQKNMRNNLQIGDVVTTIGGITGIVVRKTEDTVVIETGSDKSKIRVKIWAISENETIHDEVEEIKKK